METSFGSLEKLLECEGKVVAELATFNKEGKSHTHYDWEICYVIKGKGIIKVDDKNYKVFPGCSVSIPPRTEHYMIPEGNEDLKILLIYSLQKEAQVQ